jgi:eukaryotic-like serine/threonine-protein kinase
LRRAVVILILSLYVLSIGIPASKTATTPQTLPAGSLGGTDYPWTMFHHDALRTGVTPASSPSGPNLMWTFTTGSYVYPSPVVADGMVFIPSWDGNLYALDEYNGAQRWVFSTSAQIYATPAVANGVVYLASRDAYVYALDEQTGSMIWRRPNISPITSSPVYADGKIFYGTWFVRFNSVLMAVYTNNTVAWQYVGDDTIRSSPAVNNGRVVFGQNNGFVVAVNETTGAQLWKVAIGVSASVSTAPALAYGRVYVGADSNRFLAMNQTTGSVIWTFNTGAFNATSAAVNNGVVYFGTARGILYALNATTGAQIWIYPKAGTIGAISSSPALALGSNTLLFGSTDHSLYALNATGGALLWKYTTGAGISSSPAIADSRAFFGSWDTKVYALGVIAPRLQATIFPSVTSLKPGQVSALTITVTNGSAPEAGVTLSLSSSAGGGFTQPVMGSTGVYSSNFTAPLVNSPIATTIQVFATENGFIGGSAQTVINLVPFPPLTVVATPRPTAITPGGEILLMIRVTNGTTPVTGATIFLSSVAGGSFTNPTDGGNGNYSATYSVPLQGSSATVTIQASKPGFSSGQNSVTVTVNGIPNLTSLKVVGIPFIFLIAGAALLVLVVLIALVSRRKSVPSSPYYKPQVEPPSYASKPDFEEGLSSRFLSGLFTGLAAIAGS